MIFVPLAIIALIIWFLVFVYRQIGHGKYNRATYRVEQSRQRAEVMIRDDALAARIYDDLDKKYAEQARIVREFMGGDGKWDLFSYGCGHSLAKLVLLAQNGKMSYEYIIGSPIVCSHMLKDNAPAMIEEFVLRLEDELNSHCGGGIQAIMKIPHSKSFQQWIPLREFIQQNGKGKTLRTAQYRFGQ